MGELVHARLDYDGGRQVSAWIPARPAEAIIYAGDGQLVTDWGRDLADGVALVGVHRLDEERLRLEEYSPGVNPERFAAHERCVLGELTDWAATRLGGLPDRAHSAVFGVSAGAEMALALGLRYPERFGAILAASPGAGYQPPPVLSEPLPRAYLVAGRQEPFFLENATRWADALRHAGADVVLADRTGGHGDPFWREEFPQMAAWAFAAG